MDRTDPVDDRANEHPEGDDAADPKRQAAAMVKGAAAWATGDRDMEARAEAELRTGEPHPDGEEVEESMHRVKDRYGESVDATRTAGQDGSGRRSD